MNSALNPESGEFVFKVLIKSFEFEKALILSALEKADWVKNKAAQLLNVKRTTLVEKIKRYKIDKPPE